MDINDKKNIFSEWLEKLQQESWQLELLISGFALFGIWESRELLDGFNDYIYVNRPIDSGALAVLNIFSITLRAAWVIFFINLLFHVILRGLWIGAIGLRYVSGEIDYENLNFSDEFNKYFKRRVGRFDDYIERLEKVCSVVFAYTFLLFFIFLSFAMFIIICILLGNLIELIFGDDSKGSIVLAIMVFLFLGFIVFLDFITLGALKKVRNKRFAKTYIYLYRFFSFITLSFIYRPLLYNFIDYKYTRRLFWFSIPYVLLITLIMPNFFLEGNPHFPTFDRDDIEYEQTSQEVVSKHYYDNEREAYLAISKKRRFPIRYISLESSELSGSHGKLFIKQVNSDERLLTEKYGIISYRKSGLNHNMFGNNNTDTIIQSFENQKSKAVLKLIRARKAAKKASGKKDSTVNRTFISEFNRGLNSTIEQEPKDYWEYKIDSTKRHWKEKILSAELIKIKRIKEGLLDASQISVDGKSINKDLSCKFYEHPNLKEKGILCYFPLDSFDLGDHILTLDRSFYDKRYKDSIQHKIINIPFWKTKKE